MTTDRAIFRGDIVTMNPARPTAEALCVEGGRIKAVGAWSELRALAGQGAEVVDLGRATLLPGLIEPHSHPIVSSLLFDWVDVSGFGGASGAEVMGRLAKAAAGAEPGRWVAAFGYDPILTRDLRALNADILDKLCPDNPALVMVQTMHTIYVNHAAMARAGITDDTPQPEGGTYVKDGKGRLTGMIIEQGAAVPLLFALLMDNAYDGPALMRAQAERYARAGYTTVGVMGDFPVFGEAARHFQAMVQADDCPIRAAYMDKALDLEGGMAPALEPPSDRFRYLGVKFWYDGSPYTGNMFLDEPFLDSPLMQSGLGLPTNNRGYAMMPKERMAELVRKYHAMGHQIAVHAQGDRAVREVLDMYQEALEAHPRADHRHRIEHGALFPVDELPRASALGVAPSWHINHIYYYGQALRDEILGPERTRAMMPMAGAKAAGLTGSLHNDTPMYPPEPLRLVRTAVTRRTRGGQVIGRDQAVDMASALRAVTIDAAWQMFMEDVVGSLEPGKLADMTLLSANPLHVPPEEVDALEVLATYREGRRFEAK